MFFDTEINTWICMGLTWRCTPSEAMGLWSVVIFHLTVIFATGIHAAIQNNDTTTTTTTITRRRNDRGSRRSTIRDNRSDEDAIIILLIFFFTLAGGLLLWALGGSRYVHPVQQWLVQLTGALIVLVSTILFILAHMDMGKNWSPQPEQKHQHELVTQGVFRWARHPIYASMLWVAIGSLLGTLNWIIAWSNFFMVIYVFRRIELEERMMTDLFGDQYIEYKQRVSALGPPWGCLNKLCCSKRTSTEGGRRSETILLAESVNSGNPGLM